jgi:hypothetical protein
MVRRLRLVVPVGRGQTPDPRVPGRSPINAVEGETHGRDGGADFGDAATVAPAAFVAAAVSPFLRSAADHL